MASNAKTALVKVSVVPPEEIDAKTLDFGIGDQFDVDLMTRYVDAMNRLHNSVMILEKFEFNVDQLEIRFRAQKK